MARIDRRALFASGAAAALLAATGSSLAASPRRGGTLRLAVPRDGDMLEQVARGAIFDTLTEVAPDGVLRGELATSWHSSSDARAWTFDLRSGVRFHDGAELTAQDMVESLDVLGHSGLVVSIQAVSELQVRLELADSNPDLPFHLANPEFVIAPNGQTDVPLAEAIGTGFYRVERAQEGRHFRAARLADHYKDGQAGWVDQIEVIVIPDESVRSEALRDGYVDVAALPNPKGLNKRGGFQFYPSASEMALAARKDVGLPRVVGTRAVLDDGRMAERWWKM